MKNKMPRDIAIVAMLQAADWLAQHGAPLAVKLDAALSYAAKTQSHYERLLTQAVRDRYEGRTTNEEFTVLFSSLVYSNLRRAWLDAMTDMGEDEMITEYENEIIYYTQAEQRHISGLLAAILLAISLGAGWQSLRQRIALWANRYSDIYNRALIIIGKNAGKKRSVKLMWQFGATEQHCTDCLTYNGQVKTAQEWDDIFVRFGHRPQSPELECKGFLCDCRLSVVT